MKIKKTDPVIYPVLGCLLAMKKDRFLLDEYLFSKHGEVFKYPLPKLGLNVFNVSDPELIKKIFLNDEKNFVKHPFVLNRLTRAMGKGIFTSVGEEWKTQKQSVAPMFNPTKLQNYFDIFKNRVNELLERWERYPNGNEIETFSEMSELTLSIALKAFYNLDSDSQNREIGKASHTLQEYAQHTLSSYFLLPEWVPTKNNRELKKARAILKKLCERITVKDELLDQILNIVFASHDTSAATLTFCLYLIAGNKSVQEKIEDELSQVIKDDFSFNNLEKLIYLKQVIKESMRLYPPAWSLSRTNVDEFEYNGTVFPKNSIIVISQWLAHRNSKYWKNPLEFNPDRFSKDNESRVNKFVYFPFGIGPRSCIGAAFAMNETLTALALILSKYRFSRVDEKPFTLVSGITLAVNPELFLKLNRYK